MNSSIDFCTWVMGRRWRRPRGVAPPQPRCQHQQQRGATGATRQAMAGGARKTTAALVYLGLLLLGRQVLRCSAEAQVAKRQAEVQAERAAGRNVE